MWPMAQPNILGPLEMVTPSSGLLVSVEVARLSARLDGDADGSLIERKIKAAQRFCQREIGGTRQLLTATYDLPLTGFWSGALKMPRPPLSSVTSVKYYAADGTLTTLSTDYYEVHTPADQPGWLARKPDQTWPSVQSDRVFPVVVRFVAGYGADGSSTPETIQEAVLLVFGWLYENREPRPGDLGAVRALLGCEEHGAYA